MSVTDISLNKAALIAGLGLLIMVCTAPVAEIYLLPNMVDSKDAMQTLANIKAAKASFVAVIFLYLITFVADVVVALALYIFFKPVNNFLSLLTAWFRLIYTAMAIFGLFNLSKVLQLTRDDSSLSYASQEEIANQVLFYIGAFREEWGIAFIFFGICLALLGYLAIRATYVPRIIGILLILAGAGYFINSLQPYFFPGLDTSILMITFFGEIVFMIWLLVRWRKVSLTA